MENAEQLARTKSIMRSNNRLGSTGKRATLVLPYRSEITITWRGTKGKKT